MIISKLSRHKFALDRNTNERGNERVKLDKFLGICTPQESQSFMEGPRYDIVPQFFFLTQVIYALCQIPMYSLSFSRFKT